MVQEQTTHSPVPLRRSLPPEELVAINGSRSRYAKQVRTAQKDVSTTVGSEYDDVWPVRPGSSAIRLAPRVYTQGDTEIRVHNGAPPAPTKRKKQVSRKTDDDPQGGHPHNIHWLLYVGVGMVAALALWVGLLKLISWAQWELDNINYGMPRTYQVDAVLNQNGDSAANPTHIIFLNLYRKIEVIVIPPDASKPHLYVITTLLEDGSEVYPVKGYVKNLGNGKPDIVVIINNSGRTALINTGTDFRPLQPSDDPKY